MHGFVLGDGFCADPDDLQAAREVFPPSHSTKLMFPSRRAAQLGATAGSGGSFHAKGCDPCSKHCSQSIFTHSSMDLWECELWGMHGAVSAPAPEILWVSYSKQAPWRDTTAEMRRFETGETRRQYCD